MDLSMKSKRRLLFRIGIAAIAGAFAALIGRSGAAESMTPLEVAYAGSMGSMMDGAVRPAIAKALGADLRGRASGSTGLANLIVAGSIRPDVFISVTPGPMRIVLHAGKAASATPIARTEMVIAYSPKSQYAAALAKAERIRRQAVVANPGNAGLSFWPHRSEHRPARLEHHLHDAAGGALLSSAGSGRQDPRTANKSATDFSGAPGDGAAAGRATRRKFGLQDAARGARAAIFLRCRRKSISAPLRWRRNTSRQASL